MIWEFEKYSHLHFDLKNEDFSITAWTSLVTFHEFDFETLLAVFPPKRNDDMKNSLDEIVFE